MGIVEPRGFGVARGNSSMKESAFGLNRTLGGSVALIAAVALLSSVAIAIALGKLNTATDARKAAQQTMRDTDTFRSAMLNQETGVRGFIVTGRLSSLEPYTAGRATLDRVIPRLRTATRNRAGELGPLDAAIVAARSWQTEVGEAIVSKGVDPAAHDAAVEIERSGKGKRFFDAFREKLAAIEAAEERYAASQVELAARWSNWVFVTMVAASALTLAICALVALGINRSVVRPLKDLSVAMRRLSQRDLDVHVPGTRQRSEVGAMSRAVEVFKNNLVELDRTSLLRVTADTLPAMVGYIDARRRVGFLNNEFARWFDLGTGDVAHAHGHALERVFPGGTFPGGGAELDAALRGQEARFEHRLSSRDDGIRDVEVVFRPHHGTSGAVLGVVTLLTDITEREENVRALAAARDAAEGANRAKSAFLANMSHELRTPLSAVIGYTELLEEDAEDTGNAAVSTDLAKIKSNAKHLLGLINDVLDLSKVEANKMELVPEEVTIAAFVADAAGTVGALIGRKNNTLVIDAPDTLGTMRTDAVKLRQCLFNLLSNAAKFTESGTITLSVARESSDGGPDWIAFAVRDDGIGMSPEQLSRLFQRFSQADDTTTRKFGGTGLGLALSRAFARLMGGDIAVTSVEGKGTTFTIRLPATLPDREPEPASGANQTEAADGRGDLVLVIDDEASQRDLMSRFLRRQGFAVRTASDGPHGLDLARTTSPRVILLDVMMPGMDGWSVLKTLKADPETRDTPVVMVSFVADPSISASLGAADAMPKPVDWSRLKALLQELRQDGGGDVLVVDDDPDMRSRLRTMLERSGWAVREAEHGAEALERVAQHRPNLILLDLTMPVMDGFAFLHRLRHLPHGDEIPVVVLSARDMSAAERDSLKGADSILRKGEASLRQITEEVRRLGARA